VAGTAHLLRRLVGGAGLVGAVDLVGGILVQQLGGAVIERLSAGAAESAYAAQKMARLGILAMDATLQVIDNYNLRCESRTDVSAATLFAAPTAAQPVPPNSFAEFFNRTGRVEIIWFPFSWEPPPLLPLAEPVNPWLHVWTNSPEKPSRVGQVQQI
jgi:hypothetical protein